MKQQAKGGLLRRVAPRNDVNTHLRILAAQSVRGDAWNLGPRKQRAQGKPGARCTRSLACEIKKHTSVVTTGSPDQSGLPCAMVLTVSFVLSPVTGLVCHRRERSCLRQLDASVGASGPHDFAVRCKRRSSAPLPRPPHPAPNVRDDGQRPSYRGGTGRDVHLILVSEKQKYFCKRGWTNKNTRGR
jgi:hypothetical protein